MINMDNSYFSVPHHFNVYLELWNEEQPLPNEDDLIKLQSDGLQLVNQVKQLESSCLLQLRQIELDAKPVIDYLKLQSRKVDLVLQFMLEYQHQDKEKYIGTQFGGSGFNLLSSTPLELDKHYLSTIFISDELISLVCIAQICHAEKLSNGNYQNQFKFSVIQSVDIEQLVQASLRVQQKQLKLKKEK